MDYTLEWLRKEWLHFFLDKHHTIVPSSSLVPHKDPTLLFTTAGMVQFKELYGSSAELPFRRAVTIQKCLRTTDLNMVGHTDRHCTFFEMLGNFSFGDYFKKEAIHFAWEFSTTRLPFQKKELWVTIYQDDDEAMSIWRDEIGVDPQRIVRLGGEHNFWGPAGQSGPCGPCSELYLDRGPKKGCGKPDCRPGCDCDRFIEFWNLVFVQFHQQNFEGRFQVLF